MKVLNNGETIDLKDTLENGVKEQDFFPKNINLEDTIEFKAEDFSNDIDMSRIELENTLNLGGNKDDK